MPVLFTLMLFLAPACLLPSCSSGDRSGSSLILCDGEEIHLADPCVWESDGTYYLTGTSSGLGFDCYTSTDLHTWTKADRLFERQCYGTDAFWAPEVKEFGGKYYLNYSCLSEETGRLLTCLAVSDTPGGPFRELYTPWFDCGYSAIDGSIFIDGDGKNYLYFSRNGAEGDVSTGAIYAVALKDDLSGIDGEPFEVISPEQDWERINWSWNRCNEGANVIKVGKKYVMTFSANHTFYPGYGIGVATADHPLGPWTKYGGNPVLEGGEGVVSPGHNGLFTDRDGTVYVFYHQLAGTPQEFPFFDRVLRVKRLSCKRGEFKITD